MLEFEKDLRRVCERLRTAPVARVAAAAADTRSLLQDVADLAVGCEARALSTPPRWRDVPTLADSALGDQLEVIGRDLVTALRTAGDLDDHAVVWSRTGRVALSPVIDDLAARLASLRSAL